jgi:glycosyltransferase involved in cell wall biosynthesis
MFSILIPSWNNLPYLKLCIDSIRRHSAFEHEILVHVNDGSDGTLEWVRSEGICHTWSKGNVGVCLALNDVARLATKDWILFMNDDMFCTPGWDRAFEATLRSLGHSSAYLSSVLIEPTDSGNANVTAANFGTGPDNFDEAGLLAYTAKMTAADRDGVALQPMLISRQLWHAVGGYSIEFGPGMSSDDDFLMKLWLVGRIRRNRGGREFLMKWGISQRDFTRDYIRQTASAAVHTLPTVPRAPFRSRLKRVIYALGRYPFEDLEGWEPDLPSKLTFMTPFQDVKGDKAGGN